MATYYKREGSTPTTRTAAAGEDLKIEYSIKCDGGQLQIPEKYLKAVAKVEILRRLCAVAEQGSEYPSLDTATIKAVLGDA